MKNLNFLEEIRKTISPCFSSGVNIKKTLYKGYEVINFELEKPQLDQTFFPVLRVASIKINEKERVAFYLSHDNLIRKKRWEIEKIILKHKIFFSIY